MEAQSSLHFEKTVLLVDDDSNVLNFVHNLLTGIYTVLRATSGRDALVQSRAYLGKIDLLLSDFQMPVMNGIELATALTADRPNIRVLLMSGYPGGMLVLNEGWHFLAKPFIPSQLLALIVGLVNPLPPSRFV